MSKLISYNKYIQVCPLWVSFLFRICVVCIAPSHPVITDNSIEIESVDFQNESFDLSKNKVHGKRKSMES